MIGVGSASYLGSEPFHQHNVITMKLIDYTHHLCTGISGVRAIIVRYRIIANKHSYTGELDQVQI